MREFDVVVVGSGFGGSVAALRAAEKGYRVLVLEAGRRFGPADFARTSWDARRFLYAPRLGLWGIQRLTLLRDVLVLSGAGVGGGSLVYANTLAEPLDAFWSDPAWSHLADWRGELAPHFATARRMLGAAPVPFETPADGVVRRVAERLGAARTHRPTDVAVYFGAPGVRVPDPYFDGAGPTRRGCIRCGACMVGCRHEAKNTLDLNYLHLAERAGASIEPEREVVRVAPRPGGGYVVTAVKPGWGSSPAETVAGEQVVLAAGTLGTLRLLLRARDSQALPNLSPRLGHRVRTNSEALVGAAALDAAVDYSTGVAITSSFQPEPETQIQPVRYPRGSNLMGLLGTILVDGGGRLPRQFRFAAEAARRPVVFARSLGVRRWSERTIILLVMQARDNELRVRLGRGPLGPRLVSTAVREKRIPSFIPVANRVARLAAEEIGGYPGSSLNEVLLDVPTTAHVLGGASVGGTRAEGVVDRFHRVFGHPGLHVVDGAAVAANLGSNPALTITALAERALDHWPRKGDPDARPPVEAP